MSMEREVTISIGAELTGVRGADTLNRQIQTLEQSTANGLARMQATAGRMASTGSSMANWYAKADANFQSMQVRAGQWAGNIERSWGAFATRMQSFHGGLQTTANGVESLVRSWTIFTGSEEDLTKIIKRLMQISAVFDSIRGVSTLASGIKEVVAAFGPTAAGQMAANASGSALGNAAGGTVGGALGGTLGGGTGGYAAARMIPSITPASAVGGAGASQVVGWGSGMGGGTALGSGGGAAGSTSLVAGGGLAFLIVSAVLAAISISALVSQVSAEYQGSWLNWFNGDTSRQAAEDARSRQIFSRRMQRETGVSLFEVQSLEDTEYQVRTRVNQSMQPMQDRFAQMQTLPIQLELEGRQRLQRLQFEDANRNASHLMNRTTRGDATEQSFRDSWNANAMASQMALRDKMPSPERAANEANIRRVQSQLEDLSRRSARIRTDGSDLPRSSERERSWLEWAGVRDPIAEEMLGMRPAGQNQNQSSGNRWMRHVENAQRAMNAPSPRDTTNGNNPLQEQIEIMERQRQLAQELVQLKERQVQLTAREREQQAQTLAQERQRFQQVQEFHRNQAQSLRDQQRASASSFGFMPIDEQQRALRIAQAISRGQGNLLSPEDVSFGRGQGILTDFMSAEGERRAGNTGIAGQIEALAAPGGMSRNDRIAANERMAQQAGAIVNQIQVELSQNLQLQPDALARDIEAVLRPAMQSFRRVMDETIRQELKLDRARQMAQDFTQREKSGAGQRAAAGTP